MNEIKHMSQEEFDKYLILSIIPEVTDEYEEPSAIILYPNKEIQFAKECELCHDYILLGNKIEIPNVLLEVKNSDVKNYLGCLTELDVFDYDEISECECDADEIDSDYYEEEDSFEEDDESYDDYDEY